MNRTDLIPDYIIACCVMHNICLLKGDEFPADGILDENENINQQNNMAHERILPAEGLEKRNRICEQLLMRNV